MNLRTILIELLLAGFFGVACIRACVPASPGGKLVFSDLFRFPGRAGEFAVFMALPVRATTTDARRRGNAAVVGSR